MKRIHYASGSLLTGDDIADVIVRFAAALAHNNGAAEVRAPAVVDGLKAAGFLQRPDDLPLYLAHGLREAPPAEAWYFTGFDRDGD